MNEFKGTSPIELVKSLDGTISFSKEGIVARVEGLLDMENFIFWLKEHGYEFFFRWQPFGVEVVFKLPAGALLVP